MVEIETRSLVLLPEAPSSALLSWVVQPNERKEIEEGGMSTSARLGFDKGHRCLPGGFNVCARDDGGS